MEPVSRRQTLAGVGLIGVGLPVLAACGGGSGNDASSSDPAATTTPASPSGSESPSAAESSSSAAAQGLVAAADVPIGGGVILGDEKLVVTQPEEGTFKAFSSTCTHQGCTVTKVADGAIVCPCHTSMFSVEDGSVQGGPAPSPLPETPVSLKGGEIVRA